MSLKIDEWKKHKIASMTTQDSTLCVKMGYAKAKIVLANMDALKEFVKECEIKNAIPKNDRKTLSLIKNFKEFNKLYGTHFEE